LIGIDELIDTDQGSMNLSERENFEFQFSLTIRGDSDTSCSHGGFFSKHVEIYLTNDFAKVGFQ
jgi:hypothetical protein